MVRIALVLGLLLAVAGCSENVRGRGAAPGTPMSDLTDAEAETMDAGAMPSEEDAAAPQDSEPSGPALEDVLIYAHSADTLFAFSPDTLSVSPIGTFTLPDGSPAPSMLDLAVDRDGVVFTSSYDSLYEVDPETAIATKVGDFDIDGQRLYALSFLVPGEYHPTEETLVGATNEGKFFVINRENAQATLVGQYPQGWQSSGDIVSVEGLGTFATLKPANDNQSTFAGDVLARMLFAADGSTEAFILGPIRSVNEDFKQLFGLAYWGRALYGFGNKGELIEINPKNGAAQVMQTETGTEQFWGAGVTTVVPVIF